MERRFSYFLLLTMIFEATFDRWENAKKATCNLPEFYPGKRKFWFVHPKRIDRKKFQTMFFGYLMKHKTLPFQDLWLLCSASEKSHVDPSSSSPKNSVSFGSSTRAVSLAKKNWKAKKINFSAACLVRYPRHFILSFSSSHFGLRHPNVPFSRMKKSWKKENFEVFAAAKS